MKDTTHGFFKVVFIHKNNLLTFIKIQTKVNKKMAKLKWYSPENLVRTFKSMAVSLILGLPIMIANALVTEKGTVFYAGMGLYGVATLFLYGFLVKNWWKWK